MQNKKNNRKFHPKKLSIAIALVLGSVIATAQFSATEELSALNGNNGFVINGGSTEFEGAGASVSSAGDFNGDGIDDIIIGASFATNANGVVAGGSYVVFGRSNGFPTSIDATSLNGSNGIVISGINPNDWFGIAVGSAGDVNGDGIGDVIIGANLVDTASTNVGSSYVVFGSSDMLANPLNVATLDGTTGFVINGIADENRIGESVTSAGDINGDGIDDLIIGARLANPNGNYSGATYVVFGKSDGFAASMEFSALNGNNGFTITSGATSRVRFGVSVSAAGDINGDGIADVVIGQGAGGPNHSGVGYVVFGHSSSDFPSLLNLTGLDGSNGFALYGIAANNRAGYSVSTAGDINGDGIDDVIIGAFGANSNGNAYSGSSYVVFGNSSVNGFPSSIQASNLNGSNGFTINGVALQENSGRSVGAAGDINNDGVDDLIIGANKANPNGKLKAGGAYVLFGNTNGFASSVSISELTGTNGFVLNGVAAGDEAGRSVSAAGDVNGDGISDVIIGAFRADPNGVNSSGSSYVVFGRNFDADLVFNSGFE